MPFLIDNREIAAGSETRELVEGAPIDLGIDLDAYLEDNHVSSVVILQDGTRSIIRNPTSRCLGSRTKHHCLRVG